MNYIIVDLEWNQWHKESKRLDEIIEIGAVRLNNYLKAVDTYHSYIKPFLAPTITKDIKKLTKIARKDIASAKYYVEVIKDFVNWIGIDQYTIVFWGSDDLRVLLNHCQFYHISEQWLSNHFDLQIPFSQLHNSINRIGLKKALQLIDEQPMGRYHNALDDAFNTAKIFLEISDKLSLGEVI